MIKGIRIILLFTILCSYLTSNGQEEVKVDTLDTKSPKEWSKAEKAGLMSTVLPGLGQAYNKKYWKIPIIYVGEGALMTYVFYNHRQYKKAKDILETNDWEVNPLVVGTIGGNRVASEGNYKTVRDIHRRNRDYFIILSSLLYGLNIVDAVVDAHLSEFDLSDNLSLQVNPNFQSFNNTFAAGLSLNFNIKK